MITYKERDKNGSWSDFFQMDNLCHLTGTAIHSSSELRWSTVMAEKLKAPSHLSTTTCVLLNGCLHFAQLKESSRRGIICVQLLCT